MKKLSDSERLKLVLSSFQEGVVVTSLCRKYGISRSTFYRSKSRVVGAFVALMVRKKKVKRRHSPVEGSGKKRYRCRIK